MQFQTPKAAKPRGYGLCSPASTIQTQFRHPYVVVCHFVKAGILYVQPTYSSDFLNSRDFLLTFC